jgi:ElaB/YqjD/DUF883 family membrane-anchored ribosome-binding protein
MQQVTQQRGSNAIPGMVTGAAVGGVGGWAAAKYKNLGITTKPDLDEVFKQEPDTFKSQIEKAKDDNKSFLEKAKEAVSKYTDGTKAVDKAIEEAKVEGKEQTADDIKAVLKEKFKFEGTKEDYLKKLKNDAIEEFKLKDLAEKAKFANKTWTGIAAAAALGLLGLAVGASIKKD